VNVKALENKYVAPTYGRFDLVADYGDGAIVYSEDGKKYIDLSSGIGVNSFGVSDQIWKEAVINQLDKIQHISNLYYTKPMAELAEMLCEKTGFKKVFFGNSGAEANECLIKAARKYSDDKYGGGRSTIITLENSFHGRTMATLSATGQDAMHKHFGPFLPGFVHVPANDIDSMLAAMADNSVCAVILELIQGEGGVIPLDKDYVQAVAKAAGEKDILLLIDEVQTGNGRTGTLYAFQQFGIIPDAFSTAKGLGGGLPIGACILGEKLEETLVAGTHGSTFGGNPISAAGAVSIISRLDDVFLESVEAKGALVHSMLDGAEGITSITGMGLMIGIGVGEKSSKDLAVKCLDKGLIVLTAHDKLRLLPPLNIKTELLIEAVNILKGVIAE